MGVRLLALNPLGILPTAAATTTTPPPPTPHPLMFHHHHPPTYPPATNVSPPPPTTDVPPPPPPIFHLAVSTQSTVISASDCLFTTSFDANSRARVAALLALQCDSHHKTTTFNKGLR
jgi:hypothetical protein